MLYRWQYVNRYLYSAALKYWRVAFTSVTTLQDLFAGAGVRWIVGAELASQQYGRVRIPEALLSLGSVCYFFLGFAPLLPSPRERPISKFQFYLQRKYINYFLNGSSEFLSVLWVYKQFLHFVLSKHCQVLCNIV